MVYQLKWIVFLLDWYDLGDDFIDSIKYDRFFDEFCIFDRLKKVYVIQLCDMVDGCGSCVCFKLK